MPICGCVKDCVIIVLTEMCVWQIALFNLFLQKFWGIYMERFEQNVGGDVKKKQRCILKKTVWLLNVHHWFYQVISFFYLLFTSLMHLSGRIVYNVLINVHKTCLFLSYLVDITNPYFFHQFQTHDSISVWNTYFALSNQFPVDRIKPHPYFLFNIFFVKTKEVANIL